MIPFFSSAASRLGSLSALAATTPTSSCSRVFDQLKSDACVSMSMTQTRSPTSLATTASEDAIVLLPEPPFWVTNATVRMDSVLSVFASGGESPPASRIGFALPLCGRHG